MKNEDLFIKQAVRDNIVAYLRSQTYSAATGRNIANIIDVLMSLKTIDKAEKQQVADEAVQEDLRKEDLHLAGKEEQQNG